MSIPTKITINEKSNIKRNLTPDSALFPKNEIKYTNINEERSIISISKRK